MRLGLLLSMGAMRSGGGGGSAYQSVTLADPIPTVTEGAETLFVPHNLNAYSEDLATDWEFIGASVVSNAAVAPDGTTTAEEFRPAISSDIHVAHQGLEIETFSSNHTVKAFVKASTGRYAIIGLSNLAVGLRFASACFDMQNGIYVAERAVGTGWAVNNLEARSLPDGWYELKLDATLGASSAPQAIRTIIAGSNVGAIDTNAGGAKSYSGTGEDRFYVWGVHTFRSSGDGMQAVPAALRVAGSETYVPTVATGQMITESA